jgi:hypothetical protein
MNKSLIIGILAILIPGIIAATMYVSASNSEIMLREGIIGQQQKCETYFDKMWKILQDQAGVSREYKNAFKEIYPALMEGRYGNENGGTLMKWIQESNPNFDISLYANLQRSIEAQRTGFQAEQEKLIDMHREHQTMRKVFPSSIFIGGRPEVEITLITSGKTKDVYLTGEENETLFNK